MKPRVIIIHGTKGSPQGNWFPWLQKELQKKEIFTLVPLFPTPLNQSLKSWSEAFECQIGSITPEDILVGHSLGALFCLHAIQQQNIDPQSCYLVAPFLEPIGISEYDELNKSFYSNCLTINRSLTEYTCIYSDNDPYVPIKLSQAVTNLVSGREIIIPNGMHLNSEAGYDTFPMLRDLVLKKLFCEAL